jgi:hypothetical protein
MSQNSLGTNAGRVRAGIAVFIILRRFVPMDRITAVALALRENAGRRLPGIRVR